ncbi:MAG: hypothetical protein K8S14_04020 [Actinomycetia bacterium]|nr:hypothetical protein [Actinomycetes bacterium]
MDIFMKLLTLCLTVCTALAFAEGYSELGPLHTIGTSPVSTDDIAFSQSYAYANLLNGYSANSMADDFILAANASIDSVVVWMIYIGAQPANVDVAFYQDTGDSSPATATSVWSGTASATYIDTGDDNWGFDIIETTLVLPSYPFLTAGVYYWLEITLNYNVDFWLVQNWSVLSQCWVLNGSTWTRSDDAYSESTDAFFDLYAAPVALERETWGSIKTIF